MYGFWLRNTCIQAYDLSKRLPLVTKNRYLKLMVFSDFLCMGRCKYVGSLKFFLRYTSNYLWGLFFQSTECLILFVLLNSFDGALRVSNCTGYNSVLLPCLPLSHHFYFILTIFSQKVHCFLTIFTVIQKQLHIF